MRRHSRQRRLGRTTAWFLRSRDWRPIMVPHETDDFPPAPAPSIRRKDGYTIVTLSGEIDTARAPVLRAQLLGIPRPGASRLVVDLSAVTFCDASGLAVLVGLARRAGLLGGVVRLAAPAPLTSRVLRITGLDSWFEIFADVPKAIGAPAHAGSRDLGIFPAQASLPA